MSTQPARLSPVDPPPEQPASLAEALLEFKRRLGSATLATNETARVETRKKDGSPGPVFTYDYLSLSKLLDVVDPLLVELGLLWRAMPSQDEQGRPVLAWSMVHAPSAESDRGVFPLPVQGADPQAFGSGVTYARRYGLVAYLGLATEKDDDAQAAQQAVQGQQEQQQRSQARSRASKLTAARAGALVERAERINVADKIRLLVGNALGEDPGECDTREQRVAALRRLTVDEGVKVTEWLDKREKAALDA